MAMATSDMTSPNRCQLYTKFNLSEAIKDSRDPEKITNTSILQFLIDYYGDNIHKSTIATYLTRLVDQKLLIRVGKRGSYKYKITQYGLNQLYVNEKSI